MEKLSIRNVSLDDAEELLKIYAPYVINTAISFEYDVPSVQEFKERIQSITQKYPYLVLCENDEIIGYVYASTFHARKAYDTSVETSIYIKENCRGKGYGRMLYNALEAELLKRGIAVMFACIASTSRKPDLHLTDASIKFHEKLGFVNAGNFQNCAKKFGCWYNMVYMQKNLQEKFTDDVPNDNNIEVIDIYDNQKRVTGKVINRTDLFGKDGVLRSIIHACIFNSKNELLIQQRSGDKKSGAGMWDFSASGQVLAGETSQQGAMREIKEELGLSVEIDEAPVITKIFFNSYNDYYVVRKDCEVSDLKLQKSEVQNAKWASRKEVLALRNHNKFLSYPVSLIELVFDVGEFKD